jgi:tRNA pseudouridine32 synthase/23S rRNA pseudouridine746 synthase
MSSPISPVPILFEDGEALVIDKPGGLPIGRPRAGGRSLEDHLEALKLGFQFSPAPAHRLDTDTSGCLLLARNPRALKRFSHAFEERLVAKTYLGLVAGEVGEAEGSIELALTKLSSAKDGWKMIPARKGKPALTHWRRLGVKDGISLIEFRPVTGRTHQIRVHAASGLGLPLLGDPVYGTGDKRARRTMLHSSHIRLEREGKPAIEATAPLPSDFAAFGLAPAGENPADE